ncbi:MAG: flagellar hook-length control protein FliK [Rhodoferax sp.]
MALESLLGDGMDAPADADPSGSKGVAALAASGDPGPALGTGLASPDLPAPTRPADAAGAQGGSGPGVSQGGTQAGLMPASSTAAPARDGGAPPSLTDPAGADPLAGVAQAGPDAQAALASPAAPGPQRRPGTALRAGSAADRAVPQHWSFMATREIAQASAARGGTAMASGGADMGAARPLSAAGVQVLSASFEEAREAEPAGAAILSTLAFAGEAGARRAIRTEARVDAAQAPPGADSLGASGEAGPLGAGPAQPAAADASASAAPEETLVAPHWSADAGKETQLRIQDMPGGPLDVRIQLSGNDASVGFSSAENATRAALADSSAALSELLLQEGIRLVDVSVQAGLGGSAQQQQPASPGAGGEPSAGPRRGVDAAEAAANAGTGGRATRASPGRLDVFV